MTFFLNCTIYYEILILLRSSFCHRQGKDWASFRTAVNQTMMQPRNAKLYVGVIDKVSQQLIDR